MNNDKKWNTQSNYFAVQGVNLELEISVSFLGVVGMSDIKWWSYNMDQLYELRGGEVKSQRHAY